MKYMDFYNNNMKDLKILLKESKCNNQIFDNIANSLLNNRKRLEDFIYYVKLPLNNEDLRAFVSDYEPKFRRETFSKYPDVKLVIEGLTKILDSVNVDVDDLVTNCYGKISNIEKWSDISQCIVNRLYNINKKIIANIW